MNSPANHENIRAAFLSPQHIQVAAVFETADEARASVTDVEHDTGVGRDQITIVDPTDSHFSEKLEGDSESIGRMMWNSHLILGAVGLAVGLTIAFLLVQFGPELTQNNPMFTFIALISPGIFIGLFVAGLMGLRPDRTEIIDTVRHAIRRKHYAVIVNLKKHQSIKAVVDVLSQRSRKVVESAQ
ncbi:hypothetical protein CA267_017860 [Alteromonas pelagimontana]|uniref:Riboflavin biosynthesis protein RibA n=1 Tax=Alteromonas pelagimontana TaxID=1858656 RepID=A0A6M4MHK7_9ALTE|nr:hypothetical protein [Alteromonas pelagimontana]QJR82487.1 hypothetical protein CA267_017860 [Alteromonas pelagimontana]